MDEPAPYGNHPWTRRFPEEFRRDHGYDLMPLLPHLILEVNETSPRIRNDYRKTLHRLLCRNYLDPIRAWLNARGILSAGHLTRSEYLSFSNLHWPNELRCFKHFDIPCCDPLGAGIGQPGAAAHHIGITQARILEWITIPFPRGSSQLRDQPNTQGLETPGKASGPGHTQG